MFTVLYLCVALSTSFVLARLIVNTVLNKAFPLLKGENREYTCQFVSYLVAIFGGGTAFFSSLIFEGAWLPVLTRVLWCDFVFLLGGMLLTAFLVFARVVGPLIDGLTTRRSD